VPIWQLWALRGVVWLASCLCLVLRFHSPVGYPWTLNFFALLIYLWIGVEIAFHHTHPPSHLLEWAGQWSYSLYLMHLPLAAMLSWVRPDSGIAVVNWLLLYLAVLAGAWLFYLVVEKPSHLLARSIESKRRSRLLPCPGAPLLASAVIPGFSAAPHLADPLVPHPVRTVE
jgi:peptidoglycan/LPS O-acetylase OafA/YrhL